MIGMADMGIKKALFLVPHLTNGGAERVISEIIWEWSSKPIDIILLETEPEAYSERYTIPDNVRIITLNSKGINMITRHYHIIKDIVGIMRQYPDYTVIAFSKLVLYDLAIACFFINNRVIVSERNDPYSVPDQKSRIFLRNLIFRKADICVFQTEYAMNYFPENVRRKGFIIPNPISGAIPESYRGVREKTIAAVGRLNSQKNFKMLIDAFAKIHTEFPEYKLVIYGQGDTNNTEEKLREQIKELKLEDVVFLPGFSSNIYEDIKKCALYVSSSNYEGISNSMLEALALGLPVVVTDCPAGGARMVIRDHVNGLLVPVGDVEAMYRGIKEVLTNEKLAESLGREAVKVREEYPIEKIADRWIELL